MSLTIPGSLAKEHSALHAALVVATKSPGEVGRAAREVARLLHPHFIKEETYALPPLGLLPRLAEDSALPDDLRAAIRLTDRLASELPHMLEEHAGITAALARLADAAQKAGDEASRHFSEQLAAHALAEEEVMYPAAVLVGRWARHRLEAHERKTDPVGEAALL